MEALEVGGEPGAVWERGSHPGTQGRGPKKAGEAGGTRGGRDVGASGLGHGGLWAQEDCRSGVQGRGPCGEPAELGGAQGGLGGSSAAKQPSAAGCQRLVCWRRSREDLLVGAMGPGLSGFQGPGSAEVGEATGVSAGGDQGSCQGLSHARLGWGGARLAGPS